MEELIKKLKENNYKEFKIVRTEQIEIVDADGFNGAQEGFRFDPVANCQIGEWSEIVGESFYVIGFDTDMGDPIVADAGTPGFPVYYIMHDEWEYAEKISDSFDNFIEDLKSLEKTINEKGQTREGIRNFAQTLDKKNGCEGFYENLCYSVLEKDGFYYNEFN